MKGKMGMGVPYSPHTVLCACARTPKALLPRGHGRVVVHMGKGRRVGPEANPELSRTHGGHSG